MKISNSISPTPNQGISNPTYASSDGDIRGASSSIHGLSRQELVELKKSSTLENTIEITKRDLEHVSDIGRELGEIARDIINAHETGAKELADTTGIETDEIDLALGMVGELCKKLGLEFSGIPQNTQERVALLANSLDKVEAWTRLEAVKIDFLMGKVEIGAVDKAVDDARPSLR